jgi:hypothetical protein
MAWLSANCRAICPAKAEIYFFIKLFHANSHVWAQNSLPPAAVCSGKSKPRVDSFTQINKSNDAPGEARQSGNRLSAATTHLLSR